MQKKEKEESKAWGEEGGKEAHKKTSHPKNRKGGN